MPRDCRKYYVNELRALSRFWSQKLCKVMNIDENDISVAASDLIECYQYASSGPIKAEEVSILTVSK